MTRNKYSYGYLLITILFKNRLTENHEIRRINYVNKKTYHFTKYLRQLLSHKCIFPTNAITYSPDSRYLTLGQKFRISKIRSVIDKAVKLLSKNISNIHFLPGLFQDKNLLVIN